MNDLMEIPPPRKTAEIAAISKVLRHEICEVAKVGDYESHTGFPKAGVLSSTDRRLLIRSVFAYIEGVTYALKVGALLHGANELSVGEQLLATEKSFELKESGDLLARPAKLRTLSNVRFAFKVYAKAYQLAYVLDTSTNGWNCIQRSLKVRDRLTHPKNLSDLEVQDNEYDDGVKAFIWYERQIVRVLAESIAVMKQKIQFLRKELGASSSVDVHEIDSMATEDVFKDTHLVRHMNDDV